MDTTTIVILWDEVIEKILVKFQELAQQDREGYFPFLFENILLQPLKKLIIVALNATMMMLENPYTYIFWTTMIDQILLWLYTVLIFFFGFQFLFEIAKKIFYSMQDEKQEHTITFPLRRFLLLQCIHFIGFPILKIIVENYGMWLHDVYQILSFYAKSQKILQFEMLQMGEGGILLEVICLSLILILSLRLLIQFIQQGIYILFYFVKCYTELFYSTGIEKILDPLKALSLRVCVGFVLQRILVMEALYIKAELTTTSVFVIIALLFTAIQVPKLLQREQVVT